MSARIEPCKAALKGLYFQVLLYEILLVYGRDFKLTACTGLNVFGNMNHAVGIEIKAHNGVVALGLCWFFLNAEAVSVVVKLGNAIAFRVVYIIPED